MPRVSEREKQKSNKRILDAAARLIRENGIQSTSVSDVMKAAGLTHGGFYRHFRSKDDLVAAAFGHAVGQATASLRQASSRSEQDAARDAYIERYLSPSHVDNPGSGCPMAAVAAEMSRLEGTIAERGADAVVEMARLLQPGDDGSCHQGLAQLALLLGAVTLARLTQDKGVGEDILSAGRAASSKLNADWRGT